MHMKVSDGRVVYSTHIIEVEEDVLNESDLMHFEKDNMKNIVCYSKEECVQAIKTLKTKNYNYKIKNIINANELQDFEYSSKKEAIDHIDNGKKPEKHKKEELEKRVNTLEKQVAVLMNKLNIKH